MTQPVAPQRGIFPSSETLDQIQKSIRDLRTDVVRLRAFAESVDGRLDSITEVGIKSVYAGGIAAVLAALAAGSFSVGIRFYITRTDVACRGVRFWWPTLQARVVRVSLWNSSGTRLRQIDVPVSAVGAYEIGFTESLNLTVSDLYRVSVWETSGTVYPKTTLGGAFDTYMPPRPFYGARGLVMQQMTLFAAGDAAPGTTAGTEGYLVEPMLQEAA